MKMIEKALKDAASSDKIRCGTKEVIGSIKASDLIVVSKSVNESARRSLEEKAQSLKVKIYQFEGNSMQLGKFCGKPFRTSLVSIKAD